MGPVATVAQLVAASGGSLGPAIASVSSLLGTASKDDVEWLHAVANAAAGHLDRPGAASGPHADALLALLSSAAGALRAAGARGAADPDAAQYSLIRKLVGHGEHAAALRLGWELYDALTIAAPRPGKQQAQRQEQRPKQHGALLTGAVINLVVCSAEAGLARPDDCGRLGAAVQQLLEGLRWVAAERTRLLCTAAAATCDSPAAGCPRPVKRLWHPQQRAPTRAHEHAGLCRPSC